MNRLTKHLLAATLAGVVQLTPAFAAPAHAAATQATSPQAPRSRCTVTAVGLIADKWRALGGESGPLGCPTAPERDIAGRRGRVSTFEHGQIVWSPDQGRAMVVAAYQEGRSVIVDWGPTAPFSYDFFIVRWDIDGRNAGQRDVKKGPRDRSRVVLGASRGGVYRVALEGCRSRFLSPARCSQRWTAPADVTVRHPAPPQPKRVDPVQGATQAGDRLVYTWDKVVPGWEFFNVRWSVNGGAEQQRETPRRRGAAKQGERYEIPLTASTRVGDVYRLRVQGCNREMFAYFTIKTRCGQWTPPIAATITQPVARGSAPGGTQQPTGLSGLSLYNCHKDNRAVQIWVADRAPGAADALTYRGAIAAQYENPNETLLRGKCPAAGAQPLRLRFADAHQYRVIVVDPDRPDCGGNDPSRSACVRRSIDVRGSGQGSQQITVLD